MRNNDIYQTRSKLLVEKIFSFKISHDLIYTLLYILKEKINSIFV